MYEAATPIVDPVGSFEAVIDFPDEDLPETLLDDAIKILGLKDEIILHLDDSAIGERLRTGIEVAIVGPPNAGKSSLLNALAGREAAIVSEVAGTTRDVVEVRMDLAGLPVTLSDTAGLRDASEDIEAEGIRRAREHLAGADIRVIVLMQRTLWLEERRFSRLQIPLLFSIRWIVLRMPLRCRSATSVNSKCRFGRALALGHSLRRLRLLCRRALTVGRRRSYPGPTPEAVAECLAALGGQWQRPLPELMAEDSSLGDANAWADYRSGGC